MSMYRKRRVANPFSIWAKIKVFLIILGMLIIYWYFTWARYHYQVKPAQEELLAEISTAYLDRNISVSEIIELPKGKGNAAPYYLSALAPYDPKWAEVHGVETKSIYNLHYESEDMSKFLQGVTFKTCHFFPQYYPKVIDKEDKFPPLNAFLRVMGIMSQKVDEYIGLSYKEINPLNKQAYINLAEELSKKIIIFGHHISSERLSVRQFRTGEEIIQHGAKMLRKVYIREDKTDKVRKLENFTLEGERLLTKIDRKIRQLKPLDETYVPAIIKVALQDEDECWRNMAIGFLKEMRSGVLFYKDTDNMIAMALEKIDHKNNTQSALLENSDSN